MNIGECIKWATEYLFKSNIKYPKKDAEVLLQAATGIKKINFYVNPDISINDDDVSKFKSMVERRVLSEPIQYITNYVEFFGLDFYVDKRVLIPRPETEMLIEETLKCSNNLGQSQLLKILDIGTGSGNIAITLAKSIEKIDITAIDINPECLEIAKYNAKINNVLDKINFFKKSIIADDINGTFNVIVSNPPYIKRSEIENLPVEVKNFEPITALDGGDDGLGFYKEIIEKSKKILKNNGRIVLECGINQYKEIGNMIKTSGFLSVEKVVKDLNGIERVVIAKHNG